MEKFNYILLLNFLIIDSVLYTLELKTLGLKSVTGILLTLPMIY